MSFDLSTVIPQLPDLLRSLETGESVEIDFFEQGTERVVEVGYERELVRLRCRAYGTWQPSEPSAEADRAEFAAMVRDLARGFARALAVAVPECAGWGPYPDWRKM